MPQQLKTRMILPALALLAAVMLWAAPTASAAGFPMTISASAPTTDVSLNSGVYTPTASDANLNPADLVNELTADNVTITNATHITIDSSINATGLHNLTFNSPASLGSDATITVGGSLTFSSTIDGPGNLTLSAGGTVSLDGNVGGSLQLASLVVPTAASIDVAATIDTTGTQEYAAPITLIGGATFVSSTGGITFASTINGAQSLAVSTTGTASFDAAVGATTPLSSLTVLSPATASLGGNVTTAGTQSYGGAVSLATSNLTLTSTGGSLTFSSTVDGASNLTLSAGGTVSLDGTIGGATPLTSLAIPTATVIDVAEAEITTAKTQDYAAPVMLTGDATMVSASNPPADITFGSTVDGAHTLTVSTGGTAHFDGAIGGATPLTSVTLSPAVITALSGNVTTTGSQSYDALTMENDITFSAGGTVTFAGALTGAPAG